MHVPSTSRSLATLALATLAACGGDAAASLDGTARMADTLARLADQAQLNPMANPFLNRARAEMLATMAANQTGLGLLQNRYLLGQERLLAGQTREAIAELEKVLADARIALDPRFPQNKQFHDLLGIAYLRLAEQENCALNPAANMCILPLSGAARHTLEEGARKAIAHYQRMLETVPNDPGTRYLLNIAYLALGQYPFAVPRRWLIPGLARHRGAFPLFTNVASDAGAAVEGLSGGVCIEDFTGDGHLDIVTTSWGFRDPIRLLVADGRGGYQDRAATARLDGITGGLNCVHADYDNDGDEDLLILRGAWMGESGLFPNSLLRNRGDGTFDDVTFAAGLGSRHPTNSAAWGDFNLDGHLDLFVGNESAGAMGGPSHPSELYVSNGDGTFTEVARKSGIVLDAFVKAVAWGDVNNDGLPDLFASVLFGPNRLYLNRGGGFLRPWRFDDVSAQAGIALPNASFTSWFWDYDNDGWEDLLVLSYDVRNSGALHDAVALEYLGQPPTVPINDMPVLVEPARLYRNAGDGSFRDVTRDAGLDDKVIYAMGSNFGDLDNDGRLDFYVGTGNPDLRSVIPNRMFRATSFGTFSEVTLEGGFAHIQKGHGTAFVDLDRDGDQDVYMVMGGAYEGDRFTSVLFENPGWQDRGWIALELQGTTANRSAIGARVKLTVGLPDGTTRTLWRTIGTGGSFGAGSLRLHVGLDGAREVREVQVTWPDAARTRETHAGLAKGKSWRLVQGAPPVETGRPPVPFRRAPGTTAHTSH